jgi:hypothetical protein
LFDQLDANKDEKLSLREFTPHWHQVRTPRGDPN